MARRSLRDRLRGNLHLGDVRWCEDPRNESGGRGGEHRVILMECGRDGRWQCAVIQSNPRNPKDAVYVFAAVDVALKADVDIGSYIRLPLAYVEARRLEKKVGSVDQRYRAEIDKGIAAERMRRLATQRAKEDAKRAADAATEEAAEE